MTPNRPPLIRLPGAFVPEEDVGVLAKRPSNKGSTSAWLVGLRWVWVCRAFSAKPLPQLNFAVSYSLMNQKQR